MKKLALLSLIGVIIVSCCSRDAELQAYKNYYEATEAFLDTLEKYDNWVDRFDPYDYYEAVKELKEYK